jgi:hypothetical protein
VASDADNGREREGEGRCSMEEAGNRIAFLVTTTGKLTSTK